MHVVLGNRDRALPDHLLFGREEIAVLEDLERGIEDAQDLLAGDALAEAARPERLAVAEQDASVEIGALRVGGDDRHVPEAVHVVDALRDRGEGGDVIACPEDILRDGQEPLGARLALRIRVSPVHNHLIGAERMEDEPNAARCAS